LLGHSLTAVQKNPNYSPEFFESSNSGGSFPAQKISDHLEWLQEALALSQQQIAGSSSVLASKIQEQAKTECLSQ
jgi:hypothetical protein